MIRFGLFFSIVLITLVIVNSVSAAPDIRIEFDKIKDRYYPDELTEDEYVLSIKYNNKDIDSDVKITVEGNKKTICSECNKKFDLDFDKDDIDKKIKICAVYDEFDIKDCYKFKRSGGNDFIKIKGYIP
ncbi:MAG: hypothetical protein ACPKPY_12760 [Nitrososphaeraceae archaeon]